MPRALQAANWKAWITLLAQVLLTAVAAWMSLKADVPWLGKMGLVILGCGAVASNFPGVQRLALARRTALLGGGLSLFIPAGLLLPFESLSTVEMRLDKYLAVLSWFVAAAIVPAGCVAAERGTGSRWRLAAVIGGCVGTALWLGTAYIYNYPRAFFPAVAVLALELILIQVWFRPPDWVIQAANTLLLLLLGLVVADLFVRPAPELKTELAPEKRYYSYEVARRDPAGFARWWRVFGESLEAMGRQLYIKDPARKVRFRLKPGGRATLFQSEIRINSLGFRGREFTVSKGDVYRIVCLGESTTFGCTLSPGEKPWPELLQAKISSRLHLGRPVEVINAGIPSFTLQDNLARLETDILPLKPDLVISYHGYNGFPLLHDSFPSTSVTAPPAYNARPLRLLAMAEYRARLLLFRRHLTAQLQRNPPSVSKLLETSYSHAYAHLIDFARTNKIRLALATHAMAVSEKSDREVVEFYRAGFPAVHWLIAANRHHSTLVEQLCGMHPEVRLIEAHQELDGHHEKFIDLVHLTQQGRETLAENIFRAIREELEASRR